MPDGQPIIDYRHHREAIEARRARMRAQPAERHTIIRARVDLIHDMLKEARVGQFTFRSDEAVQNGGTGEGPSPLGYFIAAVGF